MYISIFLKIHQLQIANAYPPPDHTLCEILPDCLRICVAFCPFPPIGCRHENPGVCTVDFVPNEVSIKGIF